MTRPTFLAVLISTVVFLPGIGLGLEHFVCHVVTLLQMVIHIATGDRRLAEFAGPLAACESVIDARAPMANAKARVYAHGHFRLLL